MRKSKVTKQILLDWALEAEKAASNKIKGEIKEEWLRKAQVYRDLMAKLPTSIGGQTQGA
jgi:hypothetical protein